MIKNNNKLILLILFFLIVSACSSNDSSGPELIEMSSDEEGEEESDNEEGEEESDNEEENDSEEALNFIPPELPDLPDPALSSSRWNQVNGPFGGTITSIFKSSDGYWVTTTDNSGLSDSNLYLVEDRKSTRLNSSHSQQSRMPSSA